MTTRIEDPKSLVVADFMTKSPATTLPDLTLEDARQRMYLDNIRHLCVVDEAGKLIGILSQRDIAVAEAMNGKKWRAVRVGDAMVKDPVTIPLDLPVADAAEVMERERLGSLVVVEGGKPVGVFTTVDAMRVVRSLVSGEVVPPVNPAKHMPEVPKEERPLVEHYLRLRDLLDGAAPNPNMGRIGDFT